MGRFDYLFLEMAIARSERSLNTEKNPKKFYKLNIYSTVRDIA
jgi:hypothetical protein